MQITVEDFLWNKFGMKPISGFDFDEHENIEVMLIFRLQCKFVEGKNNCGIESAPSKLLREV